MSGDDPLMVDCGPHGKRVAAVVCREFNGMSIVCVVCYGDFKARHGNGSDGSTPAD